MKRDLLQLFYLLSAILFVMGLRGLSHPRTARRGMFLAEAGMLLAIVGSLLHHEIIDYKWIVAGLILGTLIGAPLAIWIPMTAVPQRTALSHSFGALAASLIGISEYYRHGAALGSVRVGVIGVEVMLGSLTFTGSLMAAGKLQGLIRGYPITYRGQNIFNLSILAGMLGLIVALMFVPSSTAAFYSMVGLAFFFGVMLILPIGAADMPVVIALLNSYAGLTDAAMGFMLDNKIQIITGSLDGSSGFILSILMCRAMNRSITNVLFGAFGKVEQEPAGLLEGKKPIRQCSIEEAAEILGTSRSIVFVPGYGMAVSQAQHRVREVADVLKSKGVQVRYGIHAVAGRMPGHMNVLLAEANVPYDELYDMDQINSYFPETDVAVVVGANDVVNPAAKRERGSPIYGMPILEVERAKVVIVCKRSLNPGFAGIDNELYYNDNTLMLFGDAKDTMVKLTAALKA
ncbi:MAG: NAD(P)(+) transhydrogenase (Re/Si-specific) subunit beta [Deltaproteobacteria bacterium]|nr:MAG: NAD(P)(+) transhydrogenase (Re/Si-specific) subunit beta [Deltaproteobacteria bacterium]